MLDESRAFLEDPGDEEDGWACFESIAFDGTEASLLLLVSPPAWPKTWSRFEIRTAGLRDWRMAAPHGVPHLFERDHVLARQHEGPWRSIHFRGVPAPVPEAVGRLVLAHRAMAGKWIPFDRYLNPCAAVHDLLAAGYGLLGEGPAFLMEAYSGALRESGVEPDAVAPVAPGERLATPLATLTLGDTFFVAERFEATRRPAPAA